MNNGLLSAQFDLTERAKVHRLNSFCLRYLFQAASIHLRCRARDFSPPRENENANERISVQFRIDSFYGVFTGLPCRAFLYVTKDSIIFQNIRSRFLLRVRIYGKKKKSREITVIEIAKKTFKEPQHNDHNIIVATYEIL